MEYLLLVENVSVQYGSKKEPPIQNINLEVKKGECIVLIGASGCGKTSLIRAINGLAKNYYEAEVAGKILFYNENLLEKDPGEISRSIGTLFQNPKAQFFNLDTSAELIFGCENLGLNKADISARIDRIIEQMNLDSLINRNVFKLSGGKRQKIALASILAMDPAILLLDEPTSNLDVAEVGNLERLLVQLKYKGKTIILSEHRMYWLKSLVDRYVLIQNGKIERIFSKSEFLDLQPEKLHEMGIRSFDFKSRNKEDWRASIPIFTKSFLSCRNKQFQIRMDDFSRTAGVIGIIGRNGSGKSTLIEGMLGLLKTKGAICVNDQKLKTSDCSYVMQDVTRQIFCETVSREAGFFCNVNNAEIDEVLKKLRLYEHRAMHPQVLSGGEKQRLCLASSLLSKRKVCILDEPTSGLDYANMKALSGMIGELRQQGVLVIMITHDFEMLLNCCDTIIEIDHQRAKIYPISLEAMKAKFNQLYGEGNQWN